jgi:ketosteroid isomerase-like protein
LQSPNASFAFEPTTIRTSGDMAYEIGSYSLAFEPSQGGAGDTGKYVLVWIKEDGAWKVAVDIFNSNLPMPQ